MVFIASRRQSEVYKHDTPGQKGPAPPHLHRFTVYHATRSAPQCRRGAHRIASLYRLISRTRDGNLFLRQTFPWFQLQVVASASTPCHPFAKHADRMDRGSRRIESRINLHPSAVSVGGKQEETRISFHGFSPSSRSAFIAAVESTAARVKVNPSAWGHCAG